MSVARKILDAKILVPEELDKTFMLASNCMICGKRKSRFIKNQEASNY